jgi:hypothetical protein
MKHIAWMLLSLSIFVLSCAEDKEIIVPYPSPIPCPLCPTPMPTPSPSPIPSPSPLDIDALFDATDADRSIVRDYVAKFVSDAAEGGEDVVPLFKRSPKLSIKIASLDSWGSSTIGLCEWSKSYRRVTFDPDFFNRVSSTQKLLLSHHELGHCILDRGHRSDVGTIPDALNHRHQLSIMYPVIFGSTQYNDHRPYYLDELFSVLSDEVGDGPRVYVCD